MDFLRCLTLECLDVEHLTWGRFKDRAIPQTGRCKSPYLRLTELGGYRYLKGVSYFTRHTHPRGNS